MSMNLFGKILVFLNLTLSLLLAGLALGISTNRIDWPGTGRTVPGELAKGELGKKKVELQHWTGLATQANSTWQVASVGLLKVEDERRANQKWYEDQLDVLAGRDKSGKPVAGAIGTLVYNKGQLQLDQQGRPALQAAPLKSRDAFIAELDKLKMDIAAEMTAIADLENQEAQLTLKINGEKGKQKGLRDLLGEEQLARQNSLAEAEFLKPLRINRQVEAEVLSERRQSLEARIAELKKTGVAVREP
jgi:hypothetical protein